MRKFLILVLLVVVGICMFNLPNLKADEARVIVHKFQAYTADTAVSQSKTIYRISGYATAANAVFGIYNTTALSSTAVTNVAIEGGEATSGDPIEPIDFGSEGLVLDTGSTVVLEGCAIVIEYI